MTAPATRPTAAVQAMASAPQNATRSAPRMIEAPPRLAAVLPRMSKSASVRPHDDKRQAAKGDECHHKHRRRRPDSEGGRRRQGCLDRARPCLLMDPELVSGVSTQGVVDHESIRDLDREVAVKPPNDVDVCQLVALGHRCGSDLAAFPGKIGLLGIGLGTH